MEIPSTRWDLIPKGSLTVYDGAFLASDNADYVTIPTGGCTGVTVNITGITADEIEVYASFNGTDFDWQILDGSSANPFTADTAKTIAGAKNMTDVRLKKVGSTDAVNFTVTVATQ
jgi:hypothetical protein